MVIDFEIIAPVIATAIVCWLYMMFGKRISAVIRGVAGVLFRVSKPHAPEATENAFLDFKQARDEERALYVREWNDEVKRVLTGADCTDGQKGEALRSLCGGAVDLQYNHPWEVMRREEARIRREQESRERVAKIDQGIKDAALRKARREGLTETTYTTWNGDVVRVDIAPD